MFLTISDLEPFAVIEASKAQAMIDDAEAVALMVAPCLGSTDPALTTAQTNAVRAIVRGAILRWNEAGTGAMQQQTAGPFGVTVDTRQARRGMFSTSEITQLQTICAGDGGGKAFTVDTINTTTTHLPWCAWSMGALYCSCGADLGGPIYELGGW